MDEKIKLLIIGGVAGGASCAARARRLSEDAEITIVEKGPDISFANCGMPYYIGGVISDREKLLVQTPQSLGRNLNITVRVNTEAVEIDKDKKTVKVKNTKNGREEVIAYDKLLLSPGAEAVHPPIPGIKNKNIFVLRSLADMDAIKESASRRDCATAVVIGGGYIGLEVTEALKILGKEVFLIEGTPQVMAPLDHEMAAQVHEHLKLKKVKLLLNTTVASIDDKNGKNAALLSSGEEILADIIVVAAGVRPDIKLAKDAGLKIGERGGISVDESMLTSDPHIYAAGDAVEVDDFAGNFKTLIPLAGPANRQGRLAADNIFGIKSAYKKTQGTGICKIFDLTAAMTGLNEKTCKKINRKYQKIFIYPASHASYYPGARPMSLKLLFNPENGKILGAQAVGGEGVDKRMDVLAVSLRSGLTVFDLCDMELCYAPPYGSAKDPVNYAGFVASNYINGLIDIFHPEDIKDDGTQFLLDVREKSEFDAGTIPGAVNIPHYELRAKSGNLPKDKDILAFCRSGVRSYLACRVLKQKGFKCKNLSGGYMTYKYSVGMEEKRRPDFQEETFDDTGSVCAAGGNASGQGKTIKVDASGLQCPGPVTKLKDAVEKAGAGDIIEISFTDPGFMTDVSAWCQNTGNTLLSLSENNGKCLAVVSKCAVPTAAPDEIKTKNKTLVVFSGDFDKVTAAFIIANGARTMNSEVTMFFTFWGINALRKNENIKVKKNFIEKMFGFMMPKGADKLSLSSMNMLGAGLFMIKGIMKKKNVLSLPELIKTALENGVKIVVCTMSMDLMGIKKEELIDGVSFGGVATYLNEADKGAVNLFV